jgi:hypothetical protein
MRWSSGSVSAPTSMTGGWYVCIMDMGRVDARELEREREGWWPGVGEARSLLYVSRADADCAKADAGGCSGAGDAVLEGGGFCKWFVPPHCDMKDKTAAGVVLVQLSEPRLG